VPVRAAAQQQRPLGCWLGPVDLTSVLNSAAAVASTSAPGCARTTARARAPVESSSQDAWRMRVLVPTYAALAARALPSTCSQCCLCALDTPLASECSPSCGCTCTCLLLRWRRSWCARSWAERAGVEFAWQGGGDRKIFSRLACNQVRSDRELEDSELVVAINI
jgi:hypothetical protein